MFILLLFFTTVEKEAAEVMEQNNEIKKNIQRNKYNQKIYLKIQDIKTRRFLCEKT